MSFNSSGLNIGRGTFYDTASNETLSIHTYRSKDDFISDIVTTGYFPPFFGEDSYIINNGDILLIEDISEENFNYTINDASLLSLIPTIPNNRFDQELNTFNDVQFNSITTNDIYVDRISPNLNSVVEIQRIYFSKTGNDPDLKIGSSLANTNDSLVHIQAKRDAKVFLESDTDGVATGDQPIMAFTTKSNNMMGRILEDSAQNIFYIDLGKSNSYVTQPNLAISTGGIFGNTPALGTIPDYSGGGKTQPTISIIISGSNQSINIGTVVANASAKFQIDSTTRGFLPPRMTSAQRLAISSPSIGLIVYDTTVNNLYINKNTGWTVV